MFPIKKENASVVPEYIFLVGYLGNPDTLWLNPSGFMSAFICVETFRQS
jgi:hypothetical protein